MPIRAFGREPARRGWFGSIIMAGRPRWVSSRFATVMLFLLLVFLMFLMYSLLSTKLSANILTHYSQNGGGITIKATTLKVIVCRLIDNSAHFRGGSVMVCTGGSASFEGCYFSGNSTRYGDDIYGYGTVTSITGCPASYASTQESYTLNTYQVPGTHYIYTCTKCDAGNGSAAGDTSCSTCPIGTSSTGRTPRTPCRAGK